MNNKIIETLINHFKDDVRFSEEDNALFVDPTHIPVHYDYVSVK